MMSPSPLVYFAFSLPAKTASVKRVQLTQNRVYIPRGYLTMAAKSALHRFTFVVYISLSSFEGGAAYFQQLIGILLVQQRA